jgi:hypothetical protein
MGTVSEGYEPIVDAFKRNFEGGFEVGASFSAFGIFSNLQKVGQIPICELYGGFHNKHYKRP